MGAMYKFVADSNVGEAFNVVRVKQTMLILLKTFVNQGSIKE